jgi:epoxyqueuosine reductase
VELANKVKQLAAEVGYVACGVTTAEPFERYAQALDARTDAFPETRPHYEPMRRRVDPRHDAPWVNAVVACIRRHGRYRLPSGPVGHIGRSYLVDRRRETCPDYHWPKRMTAGLRELGLRVKRGGCPERAAAARAGVARILRSGFAWREDCGTWLNIETWRVDAALPGDESTFDVPCPADCRACLDACPTDALVEPFIMRLDHCVAHLTYHEPWPIADELWQRMGPWIYGCDACQVACPLNEGKWQPDELAPWLDAVADKLTPRALAVMDERTYREIVHPLFWYISEDDLDRWRANARRALDHAAAKS